jgi:hypothetical protein
LNYQTPAQVYAAQPDPVVQSILTKEYTLQ